MTDRAKADFCRADYTRADVYVPTFAQLQNKLERLLPRGAGSLDPDIIGVARIGYTRICVQIAMFESLRKKLESLAR